MRKILVLITILVAVFLTGCLPKKEGKLGEGISETKEKTYSGTLEKMMALGIPLKCTWKKDENSYGSSWVKGKKSYAEVVQEGKTGKIIWKDGCMWSWEEGNPQGTKMCWKVSQEEMKEMRQEGAEMMKGQGDQPSDIEYSCRPATITEDRFNPPENVSFMDLDQMRQFGD